MEQTGQTGPKNRFQEMIDDLSDRERTLLKVMGGVFVVFVFSMVVFFAQQSIAEIEEETARYDTVLELIASEGPAYMQAQAEGEAEETDSRADLFTEEVLQDNDVQLTSYVAQHASAVDVDVSSYDTDEHPLGADDLGGDEDGPLIIERQLTADVRGAEMDRVVEMLHRLEESTEPVVVKRLDIRSVREPGDVRGLLVVSTFEYGDEEES